MNGETNFLDIEGELPGEDESFLQEDLELLYTAEDYQEYCFHPEPLVREWAIKQLVKIYPEEEATLEHLFQLLKLIADFEKKYIDDEELGAIPLTLDDDPREYVIVSGERESSEIAEAIAAKAEDFGSSADKFAKENPAEDWLDTWLAGYQDHKKSLKYLLAGYLQDNYRRLDPVKVNIYSGAYYFSADGYLDSEIISYVYNFYGEKRAGGKKLVKDIMNFLINFEGELNLNSLGYTVLSLRGLQTRDAYQILKHINPDLQINGYYNPFFYFNAILSYRKPEDVLQLIENACQDLSRTSIERIFFQLSELFWGEEYLDYISDFLQEDTGLDEAFAELEDNWPGNSALSRAKVKVRQRLSSKLRERKTAGIEEIFMELAGLLRDELADKYPRLELPELPGGVAELQPELILEQSQELQELSEEDFWIGLILSQLLQQRSNIFRSKMCGLILNFLMVMLIVLLEDNAFGEKLWDFLPEQIDQQEEGGGNFKDRESWEDREYGKHQLYQRYKKASKLLYQKLSDSNKLNGENTAGLRYGKIKLSPENQSEEADVSDEGLEKKAGKTADDLEKKIDKSDTNFVKRANDLVADNLFQGAGELAFELKDSQLKLLWELFSLPRKNIPEEVMELMYCYGEHFSQELHQIVRDMVNYSDRVREGEGELEEDSDREGQQDSQEDTDSEGQQGSQEERELDRQQNSQEERGQDRERFREGDQGRDRDEASNTNSNLPGRPGEQLALNFGESADLKAEAKTEADRVNTAEVNNTSGTEENAGTEEFNRYYLLYRSLEVLGEIGYQPAGPDIIKLLQNYQGEYITTAAEQALTAMDFFAPELIREAVAAGDSTTVISFLDSLRINPCLAGVKLVIAWYQKGYFTMPEPIILFLKNLGNRLGQEFIEREFQNLELIYVYEARIVLAYVTGENLDKVEFYHNKIAEYRENRQGGFLSQLLEKTPDDKFEKMLDSFEKEQREFGAKGGGINGGLSSGSRDGESIADQGKPGSEYKRTEEGAIVRKREKVGRNDPCPCDSGKKYKKCCL